VKRFLLFAFDAYYPRGGWDDLVDSYETKEAAVDAAMAIPTSGNDGRDICHIVDIEYGEIVGIYHADRGESRVEVELKQ